MLVVNFAVTGRHNCVSVAGAAYVYARTRLGAFVLPARCPHRGGPLHLATFEPQGNRLVCPWHGRATSVTKAIKAGIPAVRRGGRVTAVLPADPRSGYTLEYRPMSPELAGRHG